MATENSADDSNSSVNRRAFIKMAAGAAAGLAAAPRKAEAGFAANNLFPRTVLGANAS